MGVLPIRVRDCACEGTPHEDVGDIVFVSPTLSYAGGLAAEAALHATAEAYPVSERAPDSEKQRVGLLRLAKVQPEWLSIFVEHGAVGANFLEPFSTDAILADYSIARIVADAVTDLGYGNAVLAPFLTPPARHSPPGPTGTGGTSRRSPQTRSRRKSSSQPASEAGTPSTG